MGRLRYSILNLIAFFFFFYAAVTFSAKWESQANPSENVTVYFESGTVLKGDLSIDWSGDYILTVPEGASHRFKSFVSMTSKVDRNERSAWDSWRLYVLPVIVLVGYYLVFIHLERPRLNRRLRDIDNRNRQPQ